MQHLSDEQFVLYYYAEAGVDRAAAGHLAACASCRSSYEALQAVMAAVDEAPVPERPEAYGRLVWAALRPRLERPRWGFSRWVAAGAFATLLAIAFLAGRFWPRAPQQPAPLAAAPQVRERILLMAVGEHLERSQMVLIELANAPAAGAVDITAERRWAQDLLGDNRLYRLTAAGAGESGISDLLEELEPLLLEIAHGPERLSPSEAREFRERLERKGILFKVRVIGSELQKRTKEAA